jgi:hypothetical protein
VIPTEIPAVCPYDDCGWDQVRPTQQAADRALATHLQRCHDINPLVGVKQLDNVAFQEAYCLAVKALPIGTEFTTADMHGKVPDPPHPNHWGPAQTHAAHLGLCVELGSQRSTLSTSKRSKLTRWVRVDESMTKGATA